MIASCVVHSRNRPSRVCGKRSSVRHRTSCRTPPTLIDTRRLVCFVCAIKKGSGCIDDSDLLEIAKAKASPLRGKNYEITDHWLTLDNDRSIDRFAC